MLWHRDREPSRGHRNRADRDEPRRMRRVAACGSRSGPGPLGGLHRRPPGIKGSGDSRRASVVEQAKATTNGRRGLVVFLSYLIVLPVTLLVAEVALLSGATTLAGVSAVITFGLGLFTVPMGAVAQGYHRAPDALSPTTGVVWHLTGAALGRRGQGCPRAEPVPCAVLHAEIGSAVRLSASRGIRLHGRSGGCARARERDPEPGPLPLPG